MEIYAVRIPEFINECTKNELLQYISSKKQERVKKIIIKKAANQSLLSEVLVRYLIIKKYNIKNSNIKFQYNEYGKPFLKELDDFHYNVSHSRDWVIIVLDKHQIGIDIEYIKKKSYDDIVSRFFSEEECSVYNRLNKEEKLDYFFSLWTLKESYIKAVGKGLSIPLNDFSIKFYKKNEITINSKICCTDFYFKQYSIDNEYKLALCARHNDFCEKVNIIVFSELFSDFISLV